MSKPEHTPGPEQNSYPDEVARKWKRDRDQLLEVAEITAGNIRSLRAAHVCTTFDVWLESVEKAIAGAGGSTTTQDDLLSALKDIAAREGDFPYARDVRSIALAAIAKAEREGWKHG